MIRAAALALILAAGATPALADPNCLGGGGGGGIRLHLGLGFEAGNDDFTEQDQMDFDVLTLRSYGIDAETAERTWLGCIKVTRREGGRWVTEYYDPDTMSQVY
jgi:hypothetical protein